MAPVALINTSVKTLALNWSPFNSKSLIFCSILLLPTPKNLPLANWSAQVLE